LNEKKIVLNVKSLLEGWKSLYRKQELEFSLNDSVDWIGFNDRKNEKDEYVAGT